jgi:hypothetical protein
MKPSNVSKSGVILSAAIIMASANVGWGRLPTGNLLVNPGAETGDLTGWTAGGNSGPFVDNGSYDPGINPHSGSYDFVGGNGGNANGGNSFGTLSQNVTLASAGVTSAEVNSGDLLANVSFWVQSLNQGIPSDEASVNLEFLNSLSAEIGSDTTGLYYSIGSWENITGAYAIPAGTTTIEYQMFFQLEKGINVDSFVDDNSLIVSSAGAPGVPEVASTFPLLGAALAGLTVLRRKLA